MCSLARGCYFQEGAEVKMDMKVEHAYKRSMETVVSWIDKKINSSKTQVFFRTYAPVHFRSFSNSFVLFVEVCFASILVILHSYKILES